MQVPNEDDFYEDDEPVGDVIDAFIRGPQGVTGPAPLAGCLVTPSVNTGAIVPSLGYNQVGWMVTPDQAVANNNSPLIAQPTG